MKIVNKKLLNDASNRIAYVTLEENDYSNTNNIFTTDDLCNNQTIIDLNLNSTFETFEDNLSSPDHNKISGVYPGVFKEYQINMDKLSEANVFLLVKQAIDTINNINLKSVNTNFNLLEKREWEYAFEFCLAYLTRFGVEPSFNSYTKRMEKNNSFTAWYKWWLEYYETIINDHELAKLFYYQQKSCQNLDMFRPEGSFKDYLNDEIIVEKTKSKKFNRNSQEKVS